MDKLDRYIIINISEFLDYKDIVKFFIISKTNYKIYNDNQKYIYERIFQKYKLWMIDNPLSYTLRSKYKGFTIHKSICSNHIDWFKKIHYKLIN